MKTNPLRFAAVILALGLSSTGPADARVTWRQCRTVCEEFLFLCHDVCNTSFGSSLRPQCRRACKRMAVRKCRINKGELCPVS